MSANIEQIKAMLERTGKTNLSQKQEVDLDKERFQLEGIKGNLEGIPSNVDLEEEPEKQTSEYFKKPNYDKQVVKKMSKELAKIITDQIAEPVDLEKEYKEYVEDDPVFRTFTNRIVGLAIAKHFYELGLKAR